MFTPVMLPGSPIYAMRTERLGLQLMRGIALLGSSLFFITGLSFLPIAEASATGFVSPLFVTALSIVFLSEKVGMRRWIATAIGLTGVMIILLECVSRRRVLPDRLGVLLGRRADPDAHDERT
jgi:drug/metabolite transporter (DMT)-like permease